MRSAATCLLIAAALVGCRAQQAEAPPTIRYGEESCAHCRMLISEPRYAAMLVSTTGAVEKFDDIGCLVRYRTEHPDALQRVWVHDYATEQWLAASSAAFVQSRELATPMGSGIAALATADEAASVARATHGRTATFNQLPSLLTQASAALRE